MPFPIVNISPRSLPHSPARPDPVQGIQRALQPLIQRDRDERMIEAEREMADVRQGHELEAIQARTAGQIEVGEAAFDRQRPFLETPQERFQRSLQGTAFEHGLRERSAVAAHERDAPFRTRALDIQELGTRGQLEIGRGQLGLARDRFGLEEREFGLRERFDPRLGGMEGAGEGAGLSPQLRNFLFGDVFSGLSPEARFDPELQEYARFLMQIDQGGVPELSIPEAPPGPERQSMFGNIGSFMGGIRDRFPGTPGMMGAGGNLPRMPGGELTPEAAAPTAREQTPELGSPEQIGSILDGWQEEGVFDMPPEEHGSFIMRAPAQIREPYLERLDPSVRRDVEARLRNFRF